MSFFDEEPLPIPGPKPLNRTREREELKKIEDDNRRKEIIDALFDSWYKFHINKIFKIGAFLIALYLILRIITSL